MVRKSGTDTIDKINDSVTVAYTMEDWDTLIASLGLASAYANNFPDPLLPASIISLLSRHLQAKLQRDIHRDIQQSDIRDALPAPAKVIEAINIAESQAAAHVPKPPPKKVISKANGAIKKKP